VSQQPDSSSGEESRPRGLRVRDRIETGFEAWGRVVARHPWLAIASMLLVTVVFASGLGDLRYETSTDRFLDANDPARVDYDAFRREFVNDDTLLLVLHGDEIFSFDFLERLRALHEDLEREIPLLDEVTSLVNARVTRGSEDELIVEDLLADWPESEADLAEVAARVHANPVYRNILLSEDGHYTTVTINVVPGSSKATADAALAGFEEKPKAAHGRELELPPVLMNEELQLVMEKLLGVVERHRSADFPIWVTGNPEITYALTQAGRRDMPRYAGLATLLIIVFLSLLFRRVSGVVLPLTVVTLPLLATLGIMGWLSLPLTPTTQQLPSFLLVVCIGDAVHLLTLFYRRYDAGADEHEAMAQALGHSGLAVVMTSVTTAVGLGSFAFADLTPLAELGIAAPSGVMLALVYSVVLLPALVAVLPLRRRPVGAAGGRGGSLDLLLAGLGDFSCRRPWLVVTIWCGLVVVSIYGATRLEIAHRPLEWFDPDHPTRIAAETTNRVMRGFMPLEVVVDSGTPNGLHEPDTMRRIEALQDLAREVDVDEVHVGQVISLADILKETHQALNANDPAFYAIPEDRELIAQEMLLFENSGSDDLNELVDSRFQRARVRLSVTYHDGFRYLALVKAMDEGASRIFGDTASAQTTGLVKLWLRTFDAMLSSTARSYAIAILTIAPLMILLVGELRLGLLSLIPNLAPILMGMALMAYLGIHFDMFTMMIGTIVIGIAVDDTIHFMHGFRRNFRRGASAPEAVHQTLLSTGRALLITSLVLASGFFVQLTGTLVGSRNVGLITGLTILIAVLADLILSPALVVLAARFEERRLARR